MIRFVKHLGGDNNPLIHYGRFQAGSTQAINRGDLLELSGGNFIPLTSDKAMVGTVAIAAADIKAGDAAGDYPIMVPRKLDVWEFPLDAADAPARGSTIAVESATTVQTTVTNTLGTVWDHDGFPRPQKHLSSGGLIDSGTTTGNTNQVHFLILEAVSYLADFGS